MPDFFSKTKEYILDLVFPVICQNCKSEGQYLCISCQQKLEKPTQHCVSCGKNSSFGKTHPECQNKNRPLTGLLVAANYNDKTIQTLIWQFKYNSIKKISDTLALILSDYFVESDILDYFAEAIVIPVPLHVNRQRARGFNQSELIAKQFASNLGFSYLPIIQKNKSTKSQAKLSRKQRQINVRNAFTSSFSPSLSEKKIILVDDVASTGATLSECAKALQINSPGEIWGLVVAKN